ncbi:MAG: endonuclease [Lachnospiraceae bacterium]|nr:endonuclease [Lachnospiraceae bacterium]
MKRLMSTVGTSKQDWLRKRKTGLTGTDCSCIVNMNPYRSAYDVFLDKTTDAIKEEDNEAMRQGRDLEEYVAKRFEEETGFKLRRANAIYYNEEHPVLLADFDRLIVGQKAGVECKTVSPFSADKWKDGRTPTHYILQTLHYLAVSDYDCWYIAALIFGTGFVIRKIERDQELIDHLITIEERFWEHNVLGGNVPEPDGSENYSEMLKSQYFNCKKENKVQLFGVESDLKRRDEIRELIDKLEKEKAVIEQKIQLQLGQADSVYGTAGPYNISWISTVSQRIDTGKLKEEEPEIYEKYLKEVQGKRFTVKKVKVNINAA